MKRGLGIAYAVLALVAGAGAAWWSSTRAPSSDSTPDPATLGGPEAPAAAPPPTLARPRIERRERDEPEEVVDRRIRGQVLDAEGIPVRGAVVRELRVPSPAATATTDDEGRFVLVPTVTWSAGLIVSATGFGDTVLEAYSVRPELKIRLEKGWVISGTVRDSVSQKRLVAVPVRARPTRQTEAPTSESWKATWSADGTFRVTVPTAGTYALDVGFIGYGEDASTFDEWIPMRVEGVQAGARDLRVSVVRGRTIEGEVVDETGARVTSQVSVSVSSPAEANDSGHWGAKSIDVEGGEFRVPGLVPGRYDVSVVPLVRNDDGASLCSATIDDVDAGARGLVVRLPRGSMLRGRLVNDAGASVVGAGWVYAYPENRSRVGGLVEGKVEAGGRFRVGPLADGRRYDLSARDFAGHLDGFRSGVTSRDAEVAIVLARARQIRGRVVGEDGKPVADGVPVLAVRKAVISAMADGRVEGVTKADGTFVLDGLADLVFTVQAGGEPSDYIEVAAPDVRAGTTDVVLRVVTGVRLQGTLVDDKGEPVTSSWLLDHGGETVTPVWLVAESGGPDDVAHTSAIVEPDGTFDVRRLHPGWVRLSLQSPTRQRELGAFEAPAIGLRVVVPVR